MSTAADDRTDAPAEDAGEDSGGEAKAPDHSESLIPEDQRSEDGQVYVDRDGIDFDPEDGLYSGTAVDGTTDIPGPHESAEDVEDTEASDESAESAGSQSESDSASGD